MKGSPISVWPARWVPPIAAFLLAGCTLVDQNTFNPHAADAPVIPAVAPPVVAAVPAGPPPLLTISPKAAPAAYAGTLRKAVADARARKPTVTFDVVEMQMPDTPADAGIGHAAGAVARVIAGEGVAPGRIRLAARPDASATPQEVRVYIR